MKRLLLSCVGLALIAGLNGCTYNQFLNTPLTRGPSVGVGVDPGGAHVQVDTHLGETINRQFPPRLEYQDQWGGWHDVWGSYVDIPGTCGGVMVRVTLQGVTNSVTLNYSGRQWGLGPPNWSAWLPNFHDGGEHPLTIRVVYQDYGSPPQHFENEYPYFVMNNQGY